MSSLAVSERESHSRRVPPASRLIPGLEFPHQGSMRKKPQSVTWDRRYWADEEPEYAHRTPSADTATEMRRAIFPTPMEGGDRYRLVTQVAPDFLLAGLNLAVLISVPSFAGGGDSSAGLSSVLVYAALLTLLGYSEGLYRGDTNHEAKSVILGKVVAWTTVLCAGALCASGGLEVAVLAACAPLTYFTLLAWKRYQHRIVGPSHSRPARNVLIVGAGKSGRALAAQLASDRSQPRAVRGFLDDDERVEGDILGRVGDLARIARAEFADEVIVAGNVGREAARWLVGEARRNRLDVKIVPDLYGLESQVVACERLAGPPLLTLHEEPVPTMRLRVKRALDVGLAAMFLAAGAPLLAAIALLIKLDSPGPVFYRATRVGNKGRSFRCCKFRTMAADAERQKERLRARNEREGPFFKIADDPRVTRVGRWLRRYSLDELPQLFNVLRGEMSLVGPRPHPVDDCERYRLQDLRRLDVMPGITGLWQVTARQDPSFERNMALDLEYIERWNLWMDLRILCRTAWVVVQGSGA